MQALSQQKPEAAAWLKKSATQLDALAVLQQGNVLIGLAQFLWLNEPAVADQQKQWKARRAVSALAADWHNGMQQLQAVSGQL